MATDAKDAKDPWPDRLLAASCCFLVLGFVWPFVKVGNRGHYKSGPATPQTDLRTLSDALETFRLDVGRYPTTAEGLDALREQPPGAKGWHQYLKKDIPLDPWGHPYHYENTGGEVSLCSYGADGEPGGDGYNADIEG